MRLSFDDIAGAVGGTVIPGSAMPTRPVEGVSTDSRDVTPGSLFVCIPGETFDGHDFAGKAAEAGAAALLASRNPFDGTLPVPVVLVEDTVKALGRLARFWRGRLGPETRVIGLTGTAGKTTVKELLGQVLGRRGATARTRLNLNNQIGLPLSMLAATGEEAFWVMEAGISHAGDMDELGAILEPDVALILNVGPGHAAGLGDRGTAYYKARLLSYLAPGGMAVVSADYPELVREARAVHPELVFFSAAGRQVDYRASYVTPAGEDKGLFRLWLDGVSLDVEAPFRGAFGAENVIAVAAVAHRLGLTPDEIAAGFAGALLPKQRFACSQVGRWLVIDDSYNANPLSFARMLEAAAEMAGDRPDRPFVCVLGEMGELGALAADEHRALGRRVAAARPRAVFWKGGHGDDVAQGLEAERYAGLFSPVASAEDFLHGFASCTAEEGGVILFKGSRANKLEKLVEAFVAAQTGDAHAV
ncbi:MAG TPA: UDP-N-acetylmuramoyl-tripeptide--D-alanyl-D-alanine ligase [Candidatus Bilophila faecipullorum]|uniref:UDP-N-acetylmuramoyl-tripeptide--D-alanyl-D-alanine ligase n=4 Tax=Bilophila TaxID=35832 RepID=A0A9D1QZE3_9BACT|nr:UDP-N-acetylmuramoyl-tripeptide--D-alanyl-D-alanine ligase [uncultured Bilophila sp.]HIW78197.1 UDP-N-acetylmuramoyl-tripeptide--D-alanyl-D-alanine ligase [Candidatus Bilophila faecipullorum]